MLKAKERERATNILYHLFVVSHASDILAMFWYVFVFGYVSMSIYLCVYVCVSERSTSNNHLPNGMMRRK